MARNQKAPWRVLTIFGTRPEAIKMAPVVLELQRTPSFQPIIAVTAQHRQMLDQMLGVFGLHADFDLDVMTEGQTLSLVSERILEGLQNVFDQAHPDFVLVQGDTTTTFLGALVSFYNRVPVGHVEAGLRTGDKLQPYPEEINRRLCDVLCDLYFAATEWARGNLLSEQIQSDRIHVVGNTVIDSLFYVRDHYSLPLPDPRVKTILVTAHRRENWGKPLEDVCTALRRIVDNFPDARIVLPVHPNPTVRQTVHSQLGNLEHVSLIEPLDYVPFVQAMNSAYLILTDSGGIQEEAPSLGVPVLVLRNVTERPEAIQAGTAALVGTNPKTIFNRVSALLTDSEAYSRMAHASNPYGDGNAAPRIVRALSQFLQS
jgi:UDP-N-acetylglucosamine 2-epimerase (non-hydrolysing)